MGTVSACTTQVVLSEGLSAGVIWSHIRMIEESRTEQKEALGPAGRSAPWSDVGEMTQTKLKLEFSAWRNGYLLAEQV